MSGDGGDIWHNGSVCIDKAYSADLPAGGTVTLSAVAAEGYMFDGWYVDEAVALIRVSSDTTYTFTMESADMRVMAKFVEDTTQTTDKYSFTAVVGSDGGMIHHNGVEQPNGYYAELPAGSTVTLKAVAAEGCQFEGWYVDDVVAIGDLISTNEEYTFTVSNADVRVMARFTSIPTYTFQAVVGSDGGMIHHNGVEQPNGYYAEHTAGDTVTLTAVPDEGYNFVCWFYSDDNQEYEITSATYTFTVNSEMYVSAMFEKKVVALRLDVANAGFDYKDDSSPADVTTVEIGSTYYPNPETVGVYKVYSDDENSWLAPEDYTIDLGGLDFAKVGTYTITYTYKKDTTIKATITVSVVSSTQS